MGEVLVAKQNKPIHRRVALKLIKTGMDTKQVIENSCAPISWPSPRATPFPAKGGSARCQYFTGLNNQ
jgi:hypothetical protein